MKKNQAGCIVHTNKRETNHYSRVNDKNRNRGLQCKMFGLSTVSTILHPHHNSGISENWLNHYQSWKVCILYIKKMVWIQLVCVCSNKQVSNVFSRDVLDSKYRHYVRNIISHSTHKQPKIEKLNKPIIHVQCLKWYSTELSKRGLT